MKQFNLGEIVSNSWDMAVKHWPIFLLFSLINYFVSSFMVNVDSESLLDAASIGGVQAILEAFSSAITINPLKGLISFLVIIYLSYITLNLYVRAYRTGRAYDSVGDIFKTDFNQLALFFCVELCYALIISLGSCALVIPGIFLGVRFWYAPVLAATQGVPFTEAFQRSWDMTRGHFWDLFLMGLTMIGITILGYCACLVGVFFTQIITQFMLIISLFVLLPDSIDESTASDETDGIDYVEVQ